MMALTVVVLLLQRTTPAAIKSLSHVLEKFFLEQITRLVRQQLVFPNHVGVSLKALAGATAPT